MKKPRCGIHYQIVLNALHRLRVLNISSRIILIIDCFLIDCIHINMHFMYGTLHYVHLLVCMFFLILCL